MYLNSEKSKNFKNLQEATVESTKAQELFELSKSKACN